MKISANNYEAKDIIRIIREWSELNQKDFGKTISRSKRSIQDYESGTTNYSVAMLLDIAKKNKLKITIEK